MGKDFSVEAMLNAAMAQLSATKRKAIMALASEPDGLALVRLVRNKRILRAGRFDHTTNQPTTTSFRRERGKRDGKTRRDNLFIHSGANFKKIDYLANRVARRSNLQVSVDSRLQGFSLKAEALVGDILAPEQVFQAWCRKLGKNPERYTWKMVAGEDRAVDLDSVSESFRWLLQIDSDRKGGKVQDLIDVEVRV